jgi:hypothetical protein
MTGRCLAGKEVRGTGYGVWIRPVSSRETGEISEEERRYENGQEPKLLDIIDITLRAAKPQTFQTENHLIDEEVYWRKAGQATVDDVKGSNGLRVRVTGLKASALKSIAFGPAALNA